MKIRNYFELRNNKKMPYHNFQIQLKEKLWPQMPILEKSLPTNMYIQINKLEKKQQNKTKESRRMETVIIKRVLIKWKTKQRI